MSTAGIFSKLNEEQTAAVTAARNSVVAAGAGSGKTTVLAGRFAYLVLYRDIPAEKILTLTFTKKAAAEMYARIYRTLKTVAENGSGDAQRKARTAIESFFKTRIQTLDSYGASIVKLAAHRYGIAPDFETDNEACKEAARTQALQFLIEHRSQPALRQFLQTTRPERLAQELFADTVCAYGRISDPPAYERSLEAQFDILIRDWGEKTQRFEACLDAVRLAFAQQPAASETEKKIDRFVQAYHERTAALLPPEQVLRRYVSDVLKAPPGSRCMTAAAAAIQHDLPAWLSDVLEGVKIRKTGKHDAIALFKQAAAETESLASAAALLLQAGVSADIMPLLDTFSAQFLTWKRTNGKLTFDDVASLAVTILKNETDIRRNEKQSFDAIMIDEFQDNNAVQRDMLFLLAEKRDRLTDGIPSADDVCPDKLFFVGDEKQSIYRFRGADVSVFRSLTETLPSTDMLRLRCNYRSEPALVYASNLLFSGRTSDPAPEPSDPREEPEAREESESPGIFLNAALRDFPEYEAACTPALVPPSIAAQKTENGADVSGQDGLTPRVHVCLLDKAEPEESEDSETAAEKDEIDAAAEELSAVENEALFIAKKIHELTCGPNARYRTQDCAVLLRSYSKQIFYEKSLREAGIPYVTENIVSFFADAPVNDILHLLRLAAYPADVLSYAAVLASPFAGLSPSGVARCLEFHTAAGINTIPTDAAQPLPFSRGADELLDEDDAAAYRSGRARYERLAARARNASVADVITGLWYDEGYRYETLWSQNTALYRELYDYLYELARQADEQSLSLADFADDLYRLRQDGSRIDDMEIPLDRPPAVRIMSIHKSKGLQFPVVFICDTAAKAGGNFSEAYVSRIPIVPGAGDSMVLKPPVPDALRSAGKVPCDYFTRKFRAVQNAKEHAELRRLFYVALTRAEKEVYVSAALDLKLEAEETLEQAVVRYTAAKTAAQAENDAKKGTAALVSFGHDAVLHNGTIIGLVLPVLSAWIGRSPHPPLFTLERIPLWNRPQSKSLLRTMHRSRGADRTKRDVQRKAAPQYAACTQEKLLRVQPVPPDRFTPSTLGTEPMSRPLQPELFEPAADTAEWAELDAVLNEFKTLADITGSDAIAFTAADFGTLAHAHIEALLTGNPLGAEIRGAATLTPRQLAVVTGAAQRMAERFAASELAAAARAAHWRESEYPFRSRIKTAAGTDAFIEGAIDLLFTGTFPAGAQAERELFVVDFKTDTDVRPDRHVAQLACYRKAALDITGETKCRCILYYLRSGTAVDVSAQAAAFDISAAVENAARAAPGD